MLTPLNIIILIEMYAVKYNVRRAPDGTIRQIAEFEHFFKMVNGDMVRALSMIGSIDGFNMLSVIDQRIKNIDLTSGDVVDEAAEEIVLKGRYEDKRMWQMFRIRYLAQVINCIGRINMGVTASMWVQQRAALISHLIDVVSYDLIGEAFDGSVEAQPVMQAITHAGHLYDYSLLDFHYELYADKMTALNRVPLTRDELCEQFRINAIHVLRDFKHCVEIPNMDFMQATHSVLTRFEQNRKASRNPIEIGN